VRKIAEPANVAVDDAPARVNPTEHSNEAVDAGERQRLIDAMERSGWVQAKAARILGLTARQMGYALRKHGVEIKRF
jgi:Nif-specific regulatory protein